MVSNPSSSQGVFSDSIHHLRHTCPSNLVGRGVFHFPLNEKTKDHRIDRTHELSLMPPLTSGPIKQRRAQGEELINTGGVVGDKS